QRGLLADREVDAVDALVGLEVEGDGVPLGADLPVVFEPALFFQVVGVHLPEGAALDGDVAAEVVFAFLRRRPQVPAVLVVPDGVAGHLPFLEVLGLAWRFNPRAACPAPDGHGDRQGQYAQGAEAEQPERAHAWFSCEGSTVPAACPFPRVGGDVRAGGRA